MLIYILVSKSGRHDDGGSEPCHRPQVVQGVQQQGRGARDDSTLVQQLHLERREALKPIKVRGLLCQSVETGIKDMTEKPHKTNIITLKSHQRAHLNLNGSQYFSVALSCYEY